MLLLHQSRLTDRGNVTGFFDECQLSLSAEVYSLYCGSVQAHLTDRGNVTGFKVPIVFKMKGRSLDNIVE